MASQLMHLYGNGLRGKSSDNVLTVLLSFTDHKIDFSRRDEMLEWLMTLYTVSQKWHRCFNDCEIRIISTALTRPEIENLQVFYEWWSAVDSRVLLHAWQLYL